MPKNSDQEHTDEKLDRIAFDQELGQTFADERSDKPQQLGCLKGTDIDPIDHNGLESSYITDAFQITPNSDYMDQSNEGISFVLNFLYCPRRIKNFSSLVSWHYLIELDVTGAIRENGEAR